MRNKLLVFNFEDMDWSPHPTIEGIRTKFIQNPHPFPPLDTLIAKIEPQGEIPWHDHKDSSEFAYVLQGSGIIYAAEEETHQQAEAIRLFPGKGLVVPPRIWHQVQNSGEEDLLILALHMKEKD